MGTTKVGVYRKYHGPIPLDEDGRPLPMSACMDQRPFSWAVRWFGMDGQRYSKSFKTRKLAERFAEKKQAEVRQGKADPPQRILLRDFYKEHRKLMAASVAPTTLWEHLNAMAKLAEVVGWDMPIQSVTRLDMEHLKANRLAAGVSPATANKDIKTLRTVFNNAIGRKYVNDGRNPCVGLPMLKIGSTEPEYVPPDEFVKIFDRAKSTFWQALLVTIYTSAMRKREAQNLTWDDVDLVGGHVRVERKKANGFVQEWTPKDHERRTIPIPEQATTLLSVWRSVAPEGCPYVFMEHERWDYVRERIEKKKWRKGQDLMNNTLRRFKTLCRQAGVGLYTIHDLRRSCITNWAKTLPVHVVKELAGHSDIRTTEEFYLSVQPDDVTKAQQGQANILNGILTGNPTDPKLTHSGQKRVFPGRQANQGDKKSP